MQPTVALVCLILLEISLRFRIGRSVAVASSVRDIHILKVGITDGEGVFRRDLNLTVAGVFLLDPLDGLHRRGDELAG